MSELGWYGRCLCRGACSVCLARKTTLEVIARHAHVDPEQVREHLRCEIAHRAHAPLTARQEPRHAATP